MVAYLIVAAIWIYVILFAVIGATVFDDGDNRYITPEPHTGAQLAGEYVWMWLCALVSLILYVPLCFCLGGYIEADRGRWWAIRIGRAKNPSAGEPDIRIEKPRPGKEAFVMLLYPISYVILVLPDSICRWMQFRNKRYPLPEFFSRPRECCPTDVYPARFIAPQRTCNQARVRSQALGPLRRQITDEK
ncbi:hypothetical protein JB92DRAFT_3024151 [Gautieria morchelliformis]|nr:hypothetical protein JB92DRAFT_3024151 [Gautieria morchelliformis]